MATRRTQCDSKLRKMQSDLKGTKKALRAAAAALEGPPDRQDPGEALKLVRRALRRLR